MYYKKHNAMWNDDDRDTSGVRRDEQETRVSWISIDDALRKYYSEQRFERTETSRRQEWTVHASRARKRSVKPPPPPQAIEAGDELNDEIMDKIIYRKCWYS